MATVVLESKLVVGGSVVSSVSKVESSLAVSIEEEAVLTLLGNSVVDGSVVLDGAVVLGTGVVEVEVVPSLVVSMSSNSWSSSS